MRPLRFCFLTTFYPPNHFGGDAIGVQRLARALVRRGHHVTVVHDVDAYATLAGGLGAESPARSDSDGVEVVPLKSRLGRVSSLLTHQTGHPVVHGRRIRALLAEGRFDVVNFHNISLVGGPGLLSYGKDSLRVYMAHEHWLVCPTHVLWRHRREVCTGRQCLRCVLHYRRPPQWWRIRGYLERQLSEVDTFIAMSEFSRAKHLEFGFPRDMEVLPYFLPAEHEPDRSAAASPAHDRPYFLFVGRLEKIKGLEDVFPVFREYRDADLLVAGEGDYGVSYRAQAAGIPGIRFLGRVSLEDLDAYYRDALALIVPSKCYETFGIIVIEAFRHATPVLARRLGPLPEIVQEAGGGELFENADDLRIAMTRIQQDAAYRKSLGQAGYRAFQTHWTEEAVVPRYLDIVRRTAERRGMMDVADALSSVEVV